jgi:hypothetical protein
MARPRLDDPDSLDMTADTLVSEAYRIYVLGMSADSSNEAVARADHEIHGRIILAQFFRQDAMRIRARRARATLTPSSRRA